MSYQYHDYQRQYADVQRHSSVERRGEYRNAPRVETKRTYRDHDSRVADEIINQDGPLNDLELLARMYTGVKDDGEDVPVFEHSEISKMKDLVGLPIFIEHCYPAGVKLPRREQLNKNLYVSPTPESIPIGRVVKTYPHAAPNELWARISIDPSGLDDSEVGQLRAWLRNTLLEMSVAYGETKNPYILADGNGRKYYGPIMQRTDGKYGRCVEASLTHRGDIAGCNVVMVKASAEADSGPVLYGSTQSSSPTYTSEGLTDYSSGNQAPRSPPIPYSDYYSESPQEEEQLVRISRHVSDAVETMDANATAMEVEGGHNAAGSGQPQAMAVDSNPATGQGNAPPSQSPAAAASTPSQSANAAVAAINNAMKEQQAIGGNTPATTQFTSDAQGVRQQTTPSPVANQTSAQQQVRQAFAAAAQQQQQVAQQQNSGRKPAGDVEMSDASTRQGDKDPMAPLMDRIAALENQLKMSAVAPHVPSVAKYLGMSDSMATEFLMKTDQSYRDSVINAALAASRATASGYSQQQSQVPPMRAPTMQQQTAPAPAAQQQAPRPMQQAPPSRDEMMRANQETLRQAQQTIVGTKRTADQMLEGSSGRAGDEYLRASKGPKIDAGEGHRNYVPDALGSRSALDYQRGQQPTLHEAMVIPGLNTVSDLQKLQQGLERSAANHPNSMFADPVARNALGILGAAL